jgi:hypothetical protein
MSLKVQSSPLLEEVTDFLSSQPALTEIADFRVSEANDIRFHELLDKKQSAALTAQEEDELEEFLYIHHLLIMLKAKARIHA